MQSGSLSDCCVSERCTWIPCRAFLGLGAAISAVLSFIERISLCRLHLHIQAAGGGWEGCGGEGEGASNKSEEKGED